MGRKSKRSDLGRALLKRKERDREAAQNGMSNNAAQRAAAVGRHSVNYDDSTRLHSVLDATDLEELMLNATTANEGFAAERYPGPLAPQTVVVTPMRRNEVLSSAEKERRRALDRTALRIPRRPPWGASTTPDELASREMAGFLKWRRKIATTEEEHEMSSTIGGPMMTPFEKNLEVWRQLWRVVERSDVVIQIVDARNPLLYYCEDLHRYVAEEMGRSHLLLLNKADLLSERMITRWETYFKSHRIDALFFSAFKSSVNEVLDDSRVVGVQQLINILHAYERKAPQLQENQRLVVGMCGYPNVGKSSTINVLLEWVAGPEQESTPNTDSAMDGEMHESPTQTESSLSDDVQTMSEPFSESSTKIAPHKHIKRVAVSSTPGKTKHFQTLVLTPSVLLCDCPGLVFPNFSSSKSELIISGVLSIDQMRGDYHTPVSLIASRIPASIFSLVYGIRFPSLSDGLTTDTDSSLLAESGHVSATVLLETHARARGFMTDHNRPDTSRSARVLLKDYVNGRIIFAHAPPPREDEEGESGVGPAVFAKKGGRLMHKQIEETGTSHERYIKTKNVHVPQTNVDIEVEKNMEEVCARVSGSKKHSHKVFTRVERSYYPSV